MRKARIIVLTLLVLSIVLAFPVKAAFENTLPLSTQAFQQNGAIDNGSYTVISLTNFLAAVTGSLGVPQLITKDPKQQGQILQSSMLGFVNNGIVALYKNPVAEPSQYIADVAAHSGIIKPAYAQGVGIGFNGLLPMLSIWKAFRNIAYGFLIIVMIAIGFMMLFRMKIDPRTVITIQNAIPRIIITLILITFSYAIVGVMIEVMYLLIFITLLALGQTNQTVLQHFSGGALTNLIGTTFTTGVGGINDIVQFLGLGFNQGNIVNIVVGAIAGTAIAFGPLGLIGGIVTGLAALALPQILVALIVVVALIFLMLRIFFMLLTAWIQVFVSLMFGPIYLMFGAIPGVNTFGSWFKGLVSNLMVFPITVILMFLATYLTTTQQLGSLWTPPGLGGISGQGIAGLIGMGILLTIPNIIRGLQQSLKVQSPVSVGPGSFLGGFSGLTSIWQLAYQAKILGISLPFGRRSQALPTGNQPPPPEWVPPSMRGGGQG